MIVRNDWSYLYSYTDYYDATLHLHYLWCHTSKSSLRLHSELFVPPSRKSVQEKPFTYCTLCTVSRTNTKNSRQTGASIIFLHNRTLQGRGSSVGQSRVFSIVTLALGDGLQDGRARSVIVLLSLSFLRLRKERLLRVHKCGNHIFHRIPTGTQ